MDGLGWLVEKQCVLMSAFHWSEEYILHDLLGSKGWVFYTWALLNRSRAFDAPLILDTAKRGGYVQQEWSALMRKYYERNQR